MGKILNLVESMPTTIANEDCVATLRSMLALAEEGEIITLGVAAVCRDGDGLWTLCEADKPSRYLTLSGALRRLEQTIEKEMQAFEEAE